LFSGRQDLILPTFHVADRESSYHLYPLRINGFTEEQRNQLITALALKGISTNVHFQPLPRLSFYKNLGYLESDYPHAMAQFANEISLPVYFDLSDEEVRFIGQSLLEELDAVNR
jgi:dTDP-4-amino-4,6-dideoxygalactose transaminase